MRTILLCWCFIGIFGFSTAQNPINVNFLSQVTSLGGASDCWGWWDSLGNEYALYGLRLGGVAIVDITAPANPQIVGVTQGPPSTWRDLKTFGHYAYVVHDFSPTSPGVGLQIIDLSALPNIVYKDTIIQGMATVHNLYIDDGYAYLCGSDSIRGFSILDLNPDPWRPNFVSAYNNRYVHDIYVRNDIVYASETEFGLTLIDVSNKAQPSIIAQHPYADNLTHNAWPNDNTTAIFTTDEYSGAYVYAWDISNPANITYLDRIQSSLGAPLQESVPHNVHVLNDFLVTSYYRDGLQIVDAQYPYNMIEVGRYDTSPLTGDGFDGNWGAYPYFPSGTVIASDMQAGLFVFNVNYQRACYLEGDITDAQTGLSVAGAQVSVQGQNWGTNANVAGFYATGTQIPGTYTVTYSAFGYHDSTLTVNLSNGVLNVVDIALQPLLPLPVQLQITEAGTGNPIANPQVELVEINGAAAFPFTGDANGQVSFSVFPATYTIVAGAWGWQTDTLTVTIGSGTNNFALQLTPGYQDEFALDLGWTVNSTAAEGAWERGDPEFVPAPGNPFPDTQQPEDDINSDIGTQCYFTGLSGGSAGDNDVDDGITELISPLMDLSNYNDPVIRFHRWFYAGGGQTTPNDTLTIEVSNGNQTAVYRKIGIIWNSWFRDSIEVAQLLPLTNTMQVTFRVGDNNPGHEVEAGIDGFSAVDRNPLSIAQAPAPLAAQLQVYPLPLQERAQVTYNLGQNSLEGAHFSCFNLQGKELFQVPLTEASGTLGLDVQLPQGIYFGLLRNSTGILRAVRMVR